MDRALRVVLAIWGYIKKLAGLAAPVLSVWVFLQAYGAGLPTHEAIFWSCGVLALAAAATYYVLKLVEWLIDGFERLKDGLRVANFLEEQAAVGHQTMPIMVIVNIWYENQPENKTVRLAKKNILLRTLKAAIRQGLMRGDVAPGQDPNIRTNCELRSAIAFFRNRRWLDVKREDWTRETGELTERENRE